MVLKTDSGIFNNFRNVSFGNEKKDEKEVSHARDVLLYDEKKKHPITTGMKIQGDKFVNAVTTYPKKGLSGSKNSNFYEFLTMGMVPYLTGSAMMISVFNLANKFFDTPAAKNASKLGKKMGLGVIAYGIGKTLSKKLIETPVNLKYGIDVNLPYKKKIDELPEKSNKDNLVAYEYHKAFESVDFPRWDLFYGNEKFGDDRNAYFKSVGKKMGLKDEDLKQADQKVKPLIKEKLVKTKLFSTMSSYLWAATGVAIAMQKPWENVTFNPAQILKNHKNNSAIVNEAKNQGKKVMKTGFVKDFGKAFVESCKDLVNKGSKSSKIAGRTLLGSAILMTLAGNISTLNDFNNNRRGQSQASTSLINEGQEKVVC